MTDITSIRNFGILAHVDAGKTTTTGKILHHAGYIPFSGSVDEGTAYTDWLREEKEHAITIKSSCVRAYYKSYLLQLIDTPGHIDFSLEVTQSLKVLDSAIVVLCAVNGVQAQTIKNVSLAHTHELPQIYFVNKLDREGARFDEVIKKATEELKINPVILAFPAYIDEKFQGIIDVINKEYINISQEVLPIPKDFQILQEIYYEELINQLAFYDDEILTQEINNTVTKEMIITSLRKLCIQKKIHPLYCGSSKQNSGINLLTDAVCLFLPSPLDFPTRKDFNSLKTNDQLVYIFKTIHLDQTLHAYARVYQNTIATADVLYNLNNFSPIMIEEIFTPDIHAMKKLSQSSQGEIVLLKIKGLVQAGDTLSSQKNEKKLSALEVREPVFYMKIITETESDRFLFESAKHSLLIDDPSLEFKVDEQSGDELIGGVGELQITIFLEMLRNNYGIKIKTLKPSVRYKIQLQSPQKNTISTQIFYEGKKENIRFEYQIKQQEQEINSILITPVNKSTPSLKNQVNDFLKSPQCFDYSFTHTFIAINILEGATLPDSVLAAGIVTKLKHELSTKKIIFFEPLMNVTIDSTAEYIGVISNDIQSRRGIINSIEHREDRERIKSTIPMENLFGYANAIRSITSGNVDFTIDFKEYNRIDT